MIYGKILHNMHPGNYDYTLDGNFMGNPLILTVPVAKSIFPLIFLILGGSYLQQYKVIYYSP